MQVDQSLQVGHRARVAFDATPHEGKPLAEALGGWSTPDMPVAVRCRLFDLRARGRHAQRERAEPGGAGRWSWLGDGQPGEEWLRGGRVRRGVPWRHGGIRVGGPVARSPGVLFTGCAARG